jgi:hypothetical protein
MRMIAWLFILTALVGFIFGIVVKVFGLSPFAFELYPRSFINFVTVCLLFAIAFILMGPHKHIKE